MPTNRPQQGLNADFSSRAWHVDGNLWFLENEDAWGDEDAFVLVRAHWYEDDGLMTCEDIRKVSKEEAQRMLA